MLTHPQVPGQCARFLRGELPTCAGPAGQLDRRGGAEVVERSPARARAALGTLLAAEIYGGTVMREGVRTATTTKRASSGSRATREGRAATAPLLCGATATASAALEDLAGLLGRGRGQPRLAGALPGRVRAP